MTPERGEALTGVPAELIRQAALTYAPRAFAALARPRHAAAALRRQCVPFGGGAVRGDGQYRATGRRLSLYEWPVDARRQFRLRGRSAAAAGRGQPYQPNGPGGAFGRRRQVAGAVLLEQQHRRLQSAAVRACARHSRARICCTSSSICSRPIPPTMRTSYCRRRASSSSTTWCCRISINAVSAQVDVAPPPGECLPNQEIFRRLARAMGFSEPELFQSDAEIIAEMLAQAGIDGGFDVARRARHGLSLDRASDPVRVD